MGVDVMMGNSRPTSTPDAAAPLGNPGALHHMPSLAEAMQERCGVTEETER